jgi:hypothetical protein
MEYSFADLDNSSPGLSKKSHGEHGKIGKGFMEERLNIFTTKLIPPPPVSPVVGPPLRSPQDWD